MIKQFYPYFKKELNTALFGILFTATVVIIELSQPRLMSTIVDTYIPSKNTSMIIQTGIIMAILAVFGVIIGLVSVLCATKASNGFAYNLRQALINKVQSFSDQEMHQLGVSSLITRATNDINFVQSTTLQSLRMLVRAPVMLVSAVVMAYFTNKRLSLLIFVAETVLSILLYILLKKAYPLFVSMQKAIDKVNKTLQEGLINIRVIKSFVRESYEEKRFEVSNETLMHASQKANRLIALLNPTMMLVLFSSTLGLMAYGSRLIIIDQNLSVGQLLVFINYMIFTMNSMMMLSMTLTMFSRSKASFVRLAEVFNTEASIDDKSSNPANIIHLGQIEFEHVTFRYNKQSPIADLDDLSFTIQSGQKTGIIGSTGSGKTTLIKLLTRLLEPDSGTIKIDGIDLNKYTLNQVRSVMGVVPQKNVLFSGTILDNLRYGNPSLSEDKAWELLAHSNIDAFIKKQDQQLNMQVYQGGVNFSGGQKQRLCIARALAINPKILILDDSTSALDGATEQTIKHTLNHYYSDLTLLMIAQKISSVASMDKIIVLDNGKIVGMGNHQSLSKDNLVYQEIIASQSGKGDFDGSGD